MNMIAVPQSAANKIPTKKRKWMVGLILLVVITVLLLSNAANRSAELDEGYSMILLGGFPNIKWPLGLFTRLDVANWFEFGYLGDIAANLQNYDVHPPLWFYLEGIWRGVAGTELFTSRLLSVIITLLNIGLVAKLSRQCKAPVILACAITFLSYAVLYTGSTVRMYPLAMLFLLSGTVILLETVQEGRRYSAHTWMNNQRVWLGAALAGVCFGLGAATHMLILFPCIMLCAVVVPSMLVRRRFAAIAALTAAPLPFLAWAAGYFLVQDRRDWQFAPFDLIQNFSRVAQHYAAAVLGGTPLYVGGVWQIALSATLATVLVTVVVLATMGARSMLARTEGRVVLVGAVIMPVTLLALGAIFNRQISEPRYMVYSMPFLAIFIARGLSHSYLLRPRTVAVMAACLLMLQGIGAIGLPFARATQQAARPTIQEIARVWQDGSVLLLPEAEDTAGMTLTFVLEAKPDWSLHHIPRAQAASDLLFHVTGRPSVFLITLGDDVGRQAIDQARTTLANNGWQLVGSRASTGRQERVWEEYRHHTL